MDQYKVDACSAIDKAGQELTALGSKIWDLAEPGYHEFNSYREITGYLEKKGFRVTHQYTGIKTAFLAEYCGDLLGLCKMKEPTLRRKRVRSGTPHIAIVCRYDAPYKRGHVNGTNLVAEAAIAALIGIQAGLMFCGKNMGKVSLIGCPSIEDGGIVYVTSRKGFKTVDLTMSALPGNRTDFYPPYLAGETFKLSYTGGPAVPQKTIPERNALVAGCNVVGNVAAIREYFGKGWKANVILRQPGSTLEKDSMVCQNVVKIVAPSNTDLRMFKTRLRPCLTGAALTSGCNMDVSSRGMTYSVINNDYLIYLLELNAYFTGVLATPLKEKEEIEPKDLGLLSQKMPLIQPVFYIGTDAPVGTNEFKEAANTPLAHSYARAMGKALAMTALDLFHTPEALHRVMSTHKDKLYLDNAVKFRPFFVSKPAAFTLDTPLPADQNAGWSKIP